MHFFEMGKNDVTKQLFVSSGILKNEETKNLKAKKSTSNNLGHFFLRTIFKELYSHHFHLNVPI